MPHRNWRMRVEDILQSIAGIHRYTDGMTFESFIADEMRVDAVVRNITIIGEAAAYTHRDTGAISTNALG